MLVHNNPEFTNYCRKKIWNVPFAEEKNRKPTC